MVKVESCSEYEPEQEWSKATRRSNALASTSNRFTPFRIIADAKCDIGNIVGWWQPSELQEK